MKSIKTDSKFTSLLLQVFKIFGVITKPINYKFVGTFSKLIKLMFGTQAVIVERQNDCKIEIDLGDYYWSRMIFDDFEYEPEIQHFLGQLTKPFSFIDCGSNIGLWSIVASARKHNIKTIAVEANPSMFELLSRNARLNNERFQVVNKAIYADDNKTLELRIDKQHASTSLVNTDSSSNTVAVETIKLDTLISSFIAKKNELIVIKLDIEGVEIEGIKSAVESIQSYPVCFIYEDHGNDMSHKVSNFITKQTEMRIHMLDENMQEIRDLKQLDDIKVDPATGYNFIAVKPEFLNLLT